MKYLPLYLLTSVVLLTGCLPTTDTEDSTIDGGTIKQGMVIGDLGGVPVEMPRNSVRLLQYNGDPGWGEEREGAIVNST